VQAAFGTIFKVMGSYLKAETSFRKSVSEGFSEKQPKILKTISAHKERTC
jgi:hypothetical protein